MPVSHVMKYGRHSARIVRDQWDEGQHRCWIGNSGDVINGDCKDKPHMRQFQGLWALVRFGDGGSVLWRKP